MTTRKKKRRLVFSNLATSIDGKIATVSREFFPLGSQQDLQTMLKIRNHAEVVLMGAATVRSYRKPCLSKSKKKIVNAIVSRRLDGMDPNWPFFKSDSIRRILFVTERVSRSVARKFEDRSEIVRIDASLGLAKEILKQFDRRSLSKILVEGGGELMWEFAKEDLIDRYHLTLTPRVLGGVEAPGLVAGSGLSPALTVNLRLKSVKKAKSELFLVYESIRKRGRRHPELT